MKNLHILTSTFVFLFILPSLFGQTVEYDPLITESQIINREIQQDLIVGKTPTSQMVSATGAFVYQIPIDIPSGTGGMQPNLSLNYSSQSGSSIAGYGWSISGLSSISRIGKDLFHDEEIQTVQLELSDLFALDGNRMVLSTGVYGQPNSIYKTEAETFVNIEAIGQQGEGPEWFRVTLKNGVIMEYGNNSDSRVIGDAHNTVLQWKLNKTIDRNGNYVLYNYTNSSSENVIQSIQYTGNAAASLTPYYNISFTYKNRDDEESAYATAKGKLLQAKKLMTEIKVSYGSEPEVQVKKYELKYGLNFYSYLSEVIEYGKTDFAKYNSLQFNYNDAGHEYQEIALNIPLAPFAKVFHGDFNGDGVTDIAFLDDQTGHYELKFKLGTNDSYQAIASASPPIKSIFVAYTSLGTNQNLYRSTSNSGLNFNYVTVEVSDFNGDGRDDIMLIESLFFREKNALFDHYTNGLPKKVYIHFSNSFEQSLSFSKDSLHIPNFAYHPNTRNIDNNCFYGNRNPLVLGDFNGDGATDIFLNTHNRFKTDYEHDDNTYFPVVYYPRTSTQPIPFLFSNNFDAAKFSHKDDVYALDMNGNGKAEIMQVFEHDELRRVDVFEIKNIGNVLVKELVYFEAHPNTSIQSFPNKYLHVQVGDFNGDGKSDLLTTPKQNSTVSMFFHSNGSSFQLFDAQNISFDPSFTRLVLSDFNADGKTDVLNVGTNFMNLYYSKNNSFELEQIIPTNLPIDARTYFNIVDSDGSGFPKALSANVFDPNNQAFLYQFNKDPKHGQIKYVSSGFNELTTVNYKSISDQSIIDLYENKDQSTYPNIEFHKPIYVTSSIETPDGSGINGNGNRRETKYMYSRARLNMRGKGFLGFEKFESYSTSPISNKAIMNSEEYRLQPQFLYPQLLRSHQSFVDFPDPNEFFTERSYNNIYSIEYTHETVELDGGERYLDLVTNTIEGFNLENYTVTTENVYNSLTSKKNGNVDKVISIRGDANIGLTETTTEFKYNTYGTAIPAHVTEKKTTTVRTEYLTTLPPATSIEMFDYKNTDGNPIFKKSIHPVTNQPIKEIRFLDYDLLGNSKETKTTIFGHNYPVRTTKFKYDPSGRYLLEKTADYNNTTDYKEVWTYEDETGLLKSYNDNIPNNSLAYYNYNDMYQMESSTDEFGNTTTIVREFDIESNSINNPFEVEGHTYSIEKTTPNLGMSKVYYDHLGRERKTLTTDFEGNHVQAITNFDADGNVKTASTPFVSIGENHTSFEYDDFNRLIESSVININSPTPLSVITKSYSIPYLPQPFNYTNDFFETTVNRDASLYKYIKNDPTGLPIATSDNSGVFVNNTYNSFSQVLATEINGSLVSSAEYNNLGLQTHLHELNSGTTVYDYNDIGELEGQEDVKNNTTDYIVYDEFGRMRQKEVSGQGTFNYYYYDSGDGIGQLEKEIAPNGNEVDYVYNSNGQLSMRTDKIAGIDYIKEIGYDNEGRVNWERYPTGTEVAYEYNSEGYLEKVFDPQTGRAFFEGVSKDNYGNWTNYIQYDDLETILTFDEQGRPETTTTSGVYEREYQFDEKTANLTYRKDLLNNLEETFTYDGLDRLETATLNGATNPYLIMDYLDNGNIDKKSDIGDYTYHPSKKNAVVLVDNNQNSIHSTTQDIEFDELHNPSSIIENGVEWHFEYDVNHHRNRAQIISNGMTITRVYVGNSEFQYDQNGDLLYSVDYISGGNGLSALVVRDNSPSSAGSDPKVYSVYSDYLGSINVLTDEDGSVFAHQEFDPWGRYRDVSTWTPTNTLPSIPDWLWRGYTGHEHIEEFQLINMNGRLYDPYIGRMLSPDNFVQDASSTQAYNRYSYVLNNPLKYTDPSGEFIFTLATLVAAPFTSGASLALLPTAIGADIGMWQGGTAANGTSNPFDWNYSSGKTWGYMSAGAVAGGISGYLGGGVAASGMPFANTLAIISSSFSYSLATTMYTGGNSDVSVSVGFGSYNFTTGEFGYLGRKGNNTLEDIGYGLGALANVSDVLTGLKPGNLELRTENTSTPGNKDIIGHSQIVDERGVPLVDWGPDEQLYKGNAFRSVRGTNSYEQGIAISPKHMKWKPLIIDGVNTKRIANWSPTGKYNLAFNSCVSQTSRALNSSGIFNIGIHPYLLHGQMYLRSLGVRPTLFSYHLY